MRVMKKNSDTDLVFQELPGSRDRFCCWWCPGCAFVCFLLLWFICSSMSNSFATPWTMALQAPLTMEFPRQEHWSGLPFPSPGDLPKPGITPESPALVGGFSTSGPPGKPIRYIFSPVQIPHTLLPSAPIPHQGTLFYTGLSLNTMKSRVL